MEYTGIFVFQPDEYALHNNEIANKAYRCFFLIFLLSFQFYLNRNQVLYIWKDTRCSYTSKIFTLLKFPVNLFITLKV